MKYFWLIFHIVLWSWAYVGYANAPDVPRPKIHRINTVYGYKSGINVEFENFK